ncbi:MAG: helix-hairpin-helix domain-containing protein [Planctomycetaceae bacterium]|jgi:competence ComEA-like helix-hairpin-helix protein|nr:helix-hairpin-helix domain-containing protein [Planctomycetaceae bacterium]
MKLFLRYQDQLTILFWGVPFLGVIFSFSFFQNMKEWEPEHQKEYQFLVDMNTATVEEILALPGIGEKLAEEITLYRQTRGPFNDHREIMNVKGIGVKKLDTVKPYLREFPSVTSNGFIND